MCRNTLADFDLQHKGQTIPWMFVKKLHDVQETMNFKFANSFSKPHLLFKNKITKIKLATQTVSSGVADALDFLKNEGDPNLRDSGEVWKRLQVSHVPEKQMFVGTSFGKHCSVHT